MKANFEVKMTCHACEMLISEAVKEVGGVKSVKADHSKGKVEVEFDAPATKAQLLKAIEAEGFKAKAV